MISGYDYDYDYDHVCMYVCMYVCVRVRVYVVYLSGKFIVRKGDFRNVWVRGGGGVGHKLHHSARYAKCDNCVLQISHHIT